MWSGRVPGQVLWGSSLVGRPLSSLPGHEASGTALLPEGQPWRVPFTCLLGGDRCLQGRLPGVLGQGGGLHPLPTPSAHTPGDCPAAWGLMPMPGVCQSRVPCHKSALGTVTATGTQSWPCLADTVPRNLLQPRKLSCQRSSCCGPDAAALS